MKTINLPTTAGKNRKPGHKIDKIVLHGMSEYFEITNMNELDKTHVHAVEFLNYVDLSCHYMITPGGSVIECADPDERTTWHARGHNTNSIGIEILMPGLNSYEDFISILNTFDWISEKQSNSLAHFCSILCEKYGLTENDIKFHFELDPTRKADPGQVHDWDKFLKLVGRFLRPQV